MRPHPLSANECRRAGGLASSGRCGNCCNRPPPAKARSLRATPPPPHSLPPHAHAAARKCIAPGSLRFPTSFLPASHGTLLLILGESRREGTIPTRSGQVYRAPTGQKKRRAGLPERVPDMVGAGGMNSARLYPWRPKNRSEDRPPHWERPMPTREDAWTQLCEYTASERLRKQ